MVRGVQRAVCSCANATMRARRACLRAGQRVRYSEFARANKNTFISSHTLNLLTAKRARVPTVV